MLATYNESVDMHLLRQQSQSCSYSLAENPKQRDIQFVDIHLQSLQNKPQTEKCEKC